MTPERQFQFSLALAFGRWDVDGFLDEMPATLYAEWLSFHSEHPLDAAYAIMRGLMPPRRDAAPERAAPGAIRGSAGFVRYLAAKKTGRR